MHMNDQLDRIEKKLLEIEGKVDALYGIEEKVRTYMMWTAIITAVMILLPLLVIPFVLPAFLASQGVGL